MNTVSKRLGVGVALAAATVATTGAVRQAQLVTVTVNARCAGPNTTQITVQPWNVRLNQGDQLRWVINANANSDEIVVEPKETSRWPFATRDAMLGTKEQPARTPSMLANGRGTYKYNISLTCQSGNNPPDRVVIDPDVIVD